MIKLNNFLGDLTNGWAKTKHCRTSGVQSTRGLHIDVGDVDHAMNCNTLKGAGILNHHRFGTVL